MSRRISSGNQNDEEVPVINPPKRISKSHPEYFTIKLPLYTNFILTLNSTQDLDTHWLRLNSIYDPMWSGGYRPTAQPLGRQQWSDIYDYYRVLSSETNITFTYVKGYFGSDEVTTAYQYGISARPNHALVGYQISEDTSKTASSPNGFIEQKHSKAMNLHPKNMDVLSKSTASGETPSFPMRVFFAGGTNGCSFHYDPTQWDYHVNLQGPGVRWTAKDSSPAHTHAIGVTAAYPYNEAGLSNDDEIQIHVSCYQEFTVQWREVNDALKRTVDNTL